MAQYSDYLRYLQHVDDSTAHDIKANEDKIKNDFAERMHLLEQDMHRQKNDFEQEIKELKSTYEHEKSATALEHNNKVQTLLDGHQEEIRELTDMQQNELRRLKEAHQNELRKLTDSQNAALQEKDRKHASEIANMTSEHGRQVERLKRNAKEADDKHKATMTNLQAYYENILKDQSSQHQRDIDSKTKEISDLKSNESKIKSEQSTSIANLRATYEAKITELHKRNQEEIKSLENRKEQEINNIKATHKREIDTLREKIESAKLQELQKNQKALIEASTKDFESKIKTIERNHSTEVSNLNQQLYDCNATIEDLNDKLYEYKTDIILQRYKKALILVVVLFLFIGSIGGYIAYSSCNYYAREYSALLYQVSEYPKDTTLETVYDTIQITEVIAQEPNYIQTSGDNSAELNKLRRIASKKDEEIRQLNNQVVSLSREVSGLRYDLKKMTDDKNFFERKYNNAIEGR